MQPARTVQDPEIRNVPIFRARYRATLAYGLGIWLSTLGTDGYQSQQVSLALVQ